MVTLNTRYSTIHFHYKCALKRSAQQIKTLKVHNGKKRSLRTTWNYACANPKITITSTQFSLISFQILSYLFFPSPSHRTIIEVKQMNESYYIAFTYLHDIQDSNIANELPTRAYSIYLYKSTGEEWFISPIDAENQDLHVRVVPCYSMSQHLCQKLQSASISISKILLLLNELQTI